MKILFINFNIGATPGINNGLAVLSAVLKEKGYDVEALFICGKMDYEFDLARMKKDILKFNPDIIGISLMEPQFKYMKKFCEDLKKYYKGFVVCGGPFPTMDAESVLFVDNVDAVCVGEGEDAMLELAEALEKNNGYNEIRNLWVKDTDGSIIKNKLRPFKDISTLPREDKELFDLAKIIKLKNNQLEMTLGRGCVYKCSYCINESYLKLYKDSSEHLVTVKDYVRLKSVDAVIDEIKYIASKYPYINKIAFIDDNFLMYDDFVWEFCSKYKEDIELPFMCNANPLSLTEEKVQLLKSAGCDDIRFGVESGSERVKKEVMRRVVTNKSVIKAFEITKKLGLMSSSFNIIGLPTESREELFETLKLNASIMPDTVKVMTFYPFKNTPIYDLCENLNLIDYGKKDQLDDYDTFTCLKFPKEYRLFLKKIQVSFNWYLNLFLDNGASSEYEKLIENIEDMCENEWEHFDFDGIDSEISERLKKKGVTHYSKFMNKSLAVKFPSKHFN